MAIIHYKVDDRIRLRKKHPCGNDLFRVLRIGSDIRLLCLTCGRDMTLPRLKAEKATKEVLPPEGESDA